MDKYIIGINECDEGSTGSIAKNVLNFAEKKGFKTILICFETTSSYKNEIITTHNQFYCGINRFLCRLNGSDGFHNYFETKKIIRKISSLNISLIHLHNIHGRYINLPLIFRFAKKRNIKIVWTLHDCWCFTGRCPHFEMVGCRKWKDKCGKCPTRKEYPASYFFDGSKRMLYKKIQLCSKFKDLITIVCPSEWLVSYFKESRLGFLKSIVINNGISLIKKPNNSSILEFKDKYNLNGKRIFFCIANGFDVRKGFKFINRLADELSPKKYAFLVAGLKNNVENISKNIINLGYVESKEELGLYYSASDALLNPTLEDNFPTVNIESLFFGKPIISFKTGGSPEIIGDYCGEIINKGNYEELKKAVENFNVTKFSQKKCYDRYLKFTNEKMCLKYYDLFLNLTGGN